MQLNKSRCTLQISDDIREYSQMQKQYYTMTQAIINIIVYIYMSPNYYEDNFIINMH